MDVNQLRYFKAVAEYGTISAAAKVLFITPPAISSSMAALEEELDTKLFRRTGNRLALNRQGEIFLEYVNFILNSVSDAKTELRESLTDRKNGIVIASTSANIFADLFSDFSIANPRIPLSTSTVRPRDITAAGINTRFSFLFAAETDVPDPFATDCDSIFLFKDSPALLMHPKHPLARCSSLSPEKLSGKPLLWPRINYGLKELFTSGFSARNLPPPTFSSHNYMTAFCLAAKGAGAVLVTEHSNTTLTEGLVLRPVDLPSCRRNYRLYWRKNRILTQEDLLFLEYVKEYPFS
ncbi:MAG: LysR family transcriptional regulator [Ruminococcaceae bacterium]|nr:LysR family transcriptional regulator [Oscillospiraceae bacterium]